MRHLFDRPLGTSVPNGSLFKCDAWSLLGAGLNFAGSVMNNQINAERAASDMADYYHLVQVQRKWQKEDQNWSEGMTNRLMDRQNVYNTPRSQMERYRDAGLNPYLMMSGGAVGSGNSQSLANPNPSQRGAVTPYMRPQLENPLSSPSDKIFGASSIKSQRISALAEFSKALPDLVKSVGKDGAYRIASSFLGTNLDMTTLDNMIKVEYGRQDIAKRREDLAFQIESEFGKENAYLINQNLIYEGQRLINEASELYSKKLLNEESMRELVTRRTKNLAEAAHLNADTKTLNMLRPFVVKSADMQASMDEYDKIESETDFIQGREARAWQRSSEGRSAATAAQVVSDNPETNLVNKITHAHTSVRRKYRGK